MNITERVRDFIIEELRWDGTREELTEDYPLLESGVWSTHSVCFRSSSS